MPQHDHITGAHHRAVPDHQMVPRPERRHHRRVVDLRQPERPQRPAPHRLRAAATVLLRLAHPLRHSYLPVQPLCDLDQTILHQSRPATGLLP
ncbi:hypothetical protein GZL_03439 [Streptomyces sp. 769]|nr:hypothetical protein GZL_03439 [Streptomyces sp. 769]